MKYARSSAGHSHPGIRCRAMRHELGKKVLLMLLVTVVVATAATSIGTQASAAPSEAPALSGSLASDPASVDLTLEGTEDWAIWGVANGGTSTSLSPDVRKSGGAAISDLTDINPGSIPLRGIGQFPFATFFTFNWTNGGSQVSGSEVWAGLQHNTPDNVDSSGHGFSFTAPAGTTARQLKVYVHAHGGTGRLTARLSDSSAPDYVDTGLTGGGNTPGIYTITYAAASIGQTLTVTWVQESVGSDANATNNNVAIYAAALSPARNVVRCPGPFQVASAESFPSIDRNRDGFVCVGAIDNH